MKKEVRTVVYDDELNIEAYRFEGVVQPFPNHFHENYYVIGIIENGTRLLVCKNTEYTVARGDILIFNPNDNHGCVQCDDGTLDYRELNIPIKTMMALAEDITGSSILPVFSENVLCFCSIRKAFPSLQSVSIQCSIASESTVISGEKCSQINWRREKSFDFIVREKAVFKCVSIAVSYFSLNTFSSLEGQRRRFKAILQRDSGDSTVSALSKQESYFL